MRVSFLFVFSHGKLRHVKGLDKGKGLYFLFTRSGTKTPGGLLARTGLTRYYKSNHFKSRPYDPYNVYTSPNEAILCPDTFQSMYTQMLCGLYERDQVLRIGAVFASGLIRAIKFFQLNWQELTHDIRTGLLNPKMTDPSLRECMTRIMRPDPDLAHTIAQQCEKDDKWEGIISRIWPNTKYLDTIVTGSMARSIPIIDYYSGGLPIVCTIYASSECLFGLNLNPVCKPSEVSYTLLPNMAFFEFLPHDQHSGPELINLADVRVGKEYELVITTHTGLYRYQIQDVLLVTGFHNSAPQFRFVKRKKALLCIESDKTDEGELQSAVDNASRLLEEFQTSLVEYTSHSYTSAIPGHYVIYWELFSKNGSDNLVPDEVLDRCCLAMEESFNSMYRRFRVECGSIGPLEIRVVKSGTFQKLMDYAMARGACINQYKVPRCVSSEPMLELLDSAIVSAHFSPSLPRWTPGS